MRPKACVYDAPPAQRVANVVRSRLAFALFICISVTACAKAAEDNPLAIIDGGIQRSEDAPYVPANYEFLPGEYLFFTFHASGFQIKANQTGEIKSLSLQYQITPQDLTGTALAAGMEGKIVEDIHNEDKNWTPKRRANFLLPSFVAAGEYRVHVVVKDLLANTEVSRDYPFKIGGTKISSLVSLRADDFEFHRTADDAKALEIAAFNPGDTVYARFLMVGFKTDLAKNYRLSYGIKVLRPDGKNFLDDPKAAQIAADSFYPAQFMPGEIQVTTPRDAMRGRYAITLTVRDQIGGQTFSLKEFFTIE